MRYGFILLSLLIISSPILAEDTPTWNMPGTYTARVGTNPGWFPQITPSGTMKIWGTQLGWLGACFPFSDGKVNIGSLALDPDTTYAPEDWDGTKYTSRAYNTIGCKVQLSPGLYDYGVTGKSGPIKPDWYDEYPYSQYDIDNQIGGAPLFGLCQITQCGCDTVLPGGKTVSAVGCATSSLGSIAGRTNLNFVSMLIENGCYSGNNLIMPKAARYLGLVFLGSRGWSLQTSSKETAKGNSQTIRVDSPHYSKKKGFYYGQHWVAKGPGILFTNGSLDAGVMDPVCKYTRFSNTKYRFKEIRLFTSTYHFVLRHDGWWNNAANIFGIFYSNSSYTSSSATAKSALAMSTAHGDGQPKLTLAQIRSLIAPIKSTTVKQSALKLCAAMTTAEAGVSVVNPAAILSSVSIQSQNCLIERVETVDVVILRNSTVGESSLQDSTSIDTFDDEEMYDGDDMPEDAPEASPDHSEAQLLCVPRGPIRVFLSGQPNASWTLSIFHQDPMRNNKSETLTGQLDNNGTATVTFNHEYTENVSDNSNVRQLPLGTKLYISSMEVTDVDMANGCFFIENSNRTWGVRVINHDPEHYYPSIGQRAYFPGTLISVFPEIVVEADLVTDSEYLVDYPIQPLGMPGKWPAMANNLLGKIWGKITSVDGTTVTMTQGNEPLTIAGVDVPVKTGDTLTVNAVLRPDRNLKAIPGSAAVTED